MPTALKTSPNHIGCLLGVALLVLGFRYCHDIKGHFQRSSLRDHITTSAAQFVAPPAPTSDELSLSALEAFGKALEENLSSGVASARSIASEFQARWPSAYANPGELASDKETTREEKYAFIELHIDNLIKNLRSVRDTTGTLIEVAQKEAERLHATDKARALPSKTALALYVESYRATVERIQRIILAIDRTATELTHFQAVIVEDHKADVPEDMQIAQYPAQLERALRPLAQELLETWPKARSE